MTPVIALINNMAETSRAVQWLGLWAGGAGSIPGLVGELRSQIPHASIWPKKKKGRSNVTLLKRAVRKSHAASVSLRTLAFGTQPSRCGEARATWRGPWPLAPAELPAKTSINLPATSVIKSYWKQILHPPVKLPRLMTHRADSQPG